MRRFRTRDLLWLTLVVALALGWWVSHENQAQRHRLDAQDLQLEWDVIAQIRAQFSNLKLGMSRPAVLKTVFDGIQGKPRRPGDAFPAHCWKENEPGIRRDCIREPDHRVIVFEFGPNYAAPMGPDGNPTDDAGWQLIRFGEFSEPLPRVE